jgi:uncharacterized damage-inducible protein DinB
MKIAITKFATGVGVAALVLALAMRAPALHAQTTGPSAAAIATTQMDPAKAMDKLLSGLEGEFVGVAEAMPAAKYNFAPSASYFKPRATTNFKGVRTFAQQVAHVTQANYFFFSSFAPAKPTVDVAAIANLTSKDDLVKALKDSFAYGHLAIASITPQNAFQIVNVKSDATPVTQTAFAIAHARDHYGQLVEYLRMNGIVPPASVK